MSKNELLNSFPEELYTLAEYLADKETDILLKDHPSRGELGFCHTRWSLKKKILRERFGIDWKSLADLYPEWNFD